MGHNGKKPTTLSDKDTILFRLKKHSMYPDSGCWLFQGCLHPRLGYGGMNIGGYKYATHQLSAYLFLDFDLESDLQVNHKCSNRNCWNPEHLYVGTQVDNLNDYYREHPGRLTRARNKVED